MQRANGNSITFDGTIADCDVCAMRKGKQLAHPKKAQHAGITRPFQLCSSDLMGPFTPKAHGGFKCVSKITDQFTRWTAGLLAGGQKLRLDSFRLFATSTVIACGGRVIRWRADKGGEYTSEAFKQYYLETGITQAFAATNTPPKMACPRELAGPFAVWFAAFSSTVNSRPSCGGSSCSLRLNSATVCHPPGLTWKRRSSGYTAKEANLSHLKIICAIAFVHIKDAKKIEPKSREGMLCGFSKNEALSYRVWNPKTRRMVES